jgi:hypothetical protein
MLSGARNGVKGSLPAGGVSHPQIEYAGRRFRTA